jgi:ribokinase
MSLKLISVVVPGSLNTDIIASGYEKILGPGEYSSAGKLKITAGGKSRNIAQMMAALMPPFSVAMVGKTCRDEYGLYKVPLGELEKAKVNTSYIKVEDAPGAFPSIALIPVDGEGNNQIYVSPGFADTFDPIDIDKAEAVFKVTSKNKGICVQTLELPLKTALHCFKTANKFGLKIVFDPGGLHSGLNYQAVLNQPMFLVKPNEHEAKILTGITVTDFVSAKKAAAKLLNQKVQNVLITHGKNGAYFFNKEVNLHIPVPKVKIQGIVDETGCGDQTTATLSVALLDGQGVVNAAKTAVLAGTLQFHKAGVVPVTKEELKQIL